MYIYVFYLLDCKTFVNPDYDYDPSVASHLYSQQPTPLKTQNDVPYGQRENYKIAERKRHAPRNYPPTQQ